MRAKTIFLSIIMRFFAIFPIKDKIVFISSNGRYFNDNPKMIFEHFRKKQVKYEYIWLMNDSSITINGARVIKKRSFEAIYHLATAKIWINDSRMAPWVVKRGGQYYVQTWHGDIALKKIEKDAADKLPKQWVNNGIRDSKMIDLFITGSERMESMVRDTFWYSGKVLNVGMPRSDMFFNEDEKNEIANRIYKFYNIDAEDYFCLYAPTFRQNIGESTNYKRSMEAYLSESDCIDIIKELENRFGGTWHLIIRLHPGISNSWSGIRANGKILNGNLIDNINELIISSSAMISDYSSCIFDAMLCEKPVFLYTPDMKKYETERGFYFKMNELPFRYACNKAELKEIIKEYNRERYLERIYAFDKRLGIIHNADASGDVVDYILKNV